MGFLIEDILLAPLKGFVWIAEKIGPLAFSNPTLFLSKLKVLGIVDKDLGRTVIEGLTRGDRMKIICAKCRRKTTFED